VVALHQQQQQLSTASTILGFTVPSQIIQL
jgi:hypothetical protein